MFFLTSSTDRLGEFVASALGLFLNSLIPISIPSTHYKPEPKFAAEVGVLSGVSYEQPIGGKFSAVGKLGLSMSDEGNPWTYAGFQPTAELGLRWYFAGITENENNEGSYLAVRTQWAYQKMAFIKSYPEEHNQLYTYSVSLVWGRSWNINDRWAVKTQIGVGSLWNVESKRQKWENRNLDGYHVGNEYGTFYPADIGVTYRF